MTNEATNARNTFGDLAPPGRTDRQGALRRRANETPAGLVVRVADIEVEPAKLDAFKAIVVEEMDDAVRLEPSVVAIYAVGQTVSQPAEVF